jgi:hypothetical protein
METHDGANVGMIGKLSLDLHHTDVVNDALSPSAQEPAWAKPSSPPPVGGERVSDATNVPNSNAHYTSTLALKPSESDAIPRALRLAPASMMILLG